MQAGTILTYKLCSRAGQVGGGGVTTDLVKDRSARLLPLTDCTGSPGSPRISR